MIPSHSSHGASGFTLLELLVVVFIIGIMATMFTLSIGLAGGTDRELQRESERLETLLRLALEDAGFQARELGLRLYPDRYEFSTFDLGPLISDPKDDKWVLVEDDVFRGRRVPDVFRFELEIEGRAVNLDRSERDVEKVYRPQLFILSSGDFSDAFDIHLRSREEDIAYTLNVAIDGTTKLTRDP